MTYQWFPPNSFAAGLESEAFQKLKQSGILYENYEILNIIYVLTEASTGWGEGVYFLSTFSISFYRKNDIFLNLKWSISATKINIFNKTMSNLWLIVCFKYNLFYWKQFESFY